MRRRRRCDTPGILSVMPTVLPLASVVAAVVMAVGQPGAGRAVAPDPPADLALGAELYSTQCASCHGVDHDGVEGRGPSLSPEGEASADFVLRTGRMPLASPTVQARRGPVRYSEEEIRALVAYVGVIGDGPSIPEVVPRRGDVSAGGELYRLNCAACHVASLAGAPIGGGREAPDLTRSTATQVGEAILVGPGAMPVFGSFEQQDIDSVAAYIEDLRERNTTGPSNFGGVGPVAEGLAAWLLALVPLVAFTRWIGRPRSGRDPDRSRGGATATVAATAPENDG